MELGEMLKISREKKGYSLREVEAKLNERGISYAHTNIKRIEDELNTKAPIKVLSNLAEIYNIDKINILNLAGADIDEKFQYEDLILKCSSFFNDENVSGEDKKKLLEVLNEMYYEAKFSK